MEKLIEKLSNYPDSKYKIVLDALFELNNMIGMEKAKRKIVEIICESMVTPIHASNGNHCMVTGPPGVGKTTFIEILAKILFGLGITNKTNNDKHFDKDSFHIYACLSFIKDQAHQAIDDIKDWKSEVSDTKKIPISKLDYHGSMNVV